MADKKKTSELTTNSSPSTSATLVGVDNGETVQIPITAFVTKEENGCVHIRTKQGKDIIEVCENEDESYRNITLRLYGGDQEMRIKQEIVLGIGGVNLLKTLELNPSVYHMNEGHSSFLLLEVMKNIVKEKN